MSDRGLSEEIRELKRRLERLTAHQREMEARLWTLEDSRVFRILQQVAIFSGSIKSRLRRAVTPGAEAAEKARAYRSWLALRTAPAGDITTLAYQPRFQIVEGLAEGSAPNADADYFIFLSRGASLTANALFGI